MHNYLLKATDIHLTYRISQYRDSLRQTFVSFAHSPVEEFLKGKEIYNVLNGVSFSISQGERVGLLGVNGSGKTSLCRVLSGIISPDSGEYEIKGEVMPVFSSNLGLMPELTGEENIRLLALFYFPLLSKEDREELICESLDFADLKEFRKVATKFYSKGMLARLCLSLITSHQKDFVIMDESMDGTDYFFQKKLSLRMKRYIQNSKGLLLVSHSNEELKANCDRVLVLNKGKIAFSGPSDESIAFYKTISES